MYGLATISEELPEFETLFFGVILLGWSQAFASWSLYLPRFCPHVPLSIVDDSAPPLIYKSPASFAHLFCRLRLIQPRIRFGWCDVR
jgi:hypothetical protein